MRWTLLLLPLLIVGFLQFPSPVQVTPEAEPKVVVGPLLTPPNPDVYSRMPYVLQPTGQRISVTPAAAEEELIVILIDFPDRQASVSPSTFDGLLFDETPGVRTLYTYYLENSYGQTAVRGFVTPAWERSALSMNYYGADGDGIDDANGPIYCLTAEAALQADSSVDFRQFDRNGDGEVDHLVVVHAGDGQENSPQTNLIWSHRWAVIDARDCGIPSRELVLDGVRIYGYFMTSEQSPLGVFAHELAHDFGLPDLYDTTGSTLGIGVWGVMGTGSWNGAPRGSIPAHFTAWSKVALGWMDFTEVSSALLPANIPQIEDNANALKLPIKTSLSGDEYFVVENRQRVGFDAALPSSGLLIWHVDETRRNNDVAARRLVDLEEADDDLGFFNQDKPDQASDSWRDDPIGFTPTSIPNSNDNTGTRTGWKVASIGPSGSVMTANISKGVAIDLSVTAIEKPDFVTVNTTAQISVRVLNRGLSEVVNGSLTLDIYFSAYEPGSRVTSNQRAIPVLQEGGATTISFSFAPPLKGRYILEASAPLPGDEVPENNFRIAHITSGEFLLMANTEGSVSSWTRTPGSESPHRWEVVADGDGFGEARSPTRAWRFGYYGAVGPPMTYEYHYLLTPVIPLDGKTPRLSFYQRYVLTTRTEGAAFQPLSSDFANVEVSLDGGPWIRVATYQGNQLTWKRTYVDLASYSANASALQVRFNATANVMPDTGGWWIDDIVVLTEPLRSAALVKPLESEKEVVAGATTSFIFLLVNVGDVEDEFHFRVEGLPSDWEASIGSNETAAVPVEDYTITLDVDEQASLSLIVRASILAERGVPIQATLVAFPSDEIDSATFIFTVQVPLGFGLNLSGRTLVVVLIVGGLMLAIAVVLTALRKRGRANY